MKIYYLLFSILILPFLSTAQDGLQTVKGQIIDQQSEMPLIGATIELIGNDALGTQTDFDGYFVLDGVPVGRQAFSVSYLGYETVTVPNVEVSAGKEVMLNIGMQESLVQLEELVITASVDKDRPQNEMATVSARQFSMEEVNRFSGGRSDVGRLAGNFAGVSTADDSRNDIVIRGNSPTGVLWRLEGIPIPSPNHFSTIGTTGGPVSALNPNLLSNSDFMTSAFAAEYGDALSGVFDLGFRNGNKDEMEYMFQLGAVTGFEGMIEGPIQGTKNGSFIIAGRYSFLGAATALGLDIGTNAVPNYQDLSFKFNFGRTPLGQFTLFGIGGTSDIEFLHDETDDQDLFAQQDEDAFADSQFGVLGLKHNLLLNDKSYVRTVIALSTTGTTFSTNRYFNQDTSEEYTLPFDRADDSLDKLSISSFYNRKFNARLTLRSGILIERTSIGLQFLSADLDTESPVGQQNLITAYDFDGSAVTTQPFAQVQYKFNSDWTINAGLHGLHSNLNEKFVAEPRLGISWKAAPKHTLSLGYGLHHQNQVLPIQLLESTDESGNPVLSNLDLDFTQSHHFVLGHDFKINSSWRSKVEVYMQSIQNVPVDPQEGSFSALNVGADFGFPQDKDNLVNEGTGRNMGVELTLEKFFNQGYYVLFTGSVFDSKYTGFDGIERNTAFNNQYVLNALAGKEFQWGKLKQHRFTIDTKLTTAGGRFYTPVDLDASRERMSEVFIGEEAFSLQNTSYFRWDLKIGVKLNSTKRKFSQSFFFDIQNVTNQDNIFRRAYNRNTNEVNDILQIGFFPNFIYKLEF